MKPIRSAILLAFLLSFSPVFAQKKSLSMEDAVLKGRTALAPANLRQLQWIAGEPRFSHVAQNKLVRVWAADLATDTLDFLPAINAALAADGRAELKNFPAITWTAPDAFFFQNEGAAWTFSISKNEAKKAASWPKDLENADFHSKTMRIAGTDEAGSWLKIFSENGRETVVARSEKKGVKVGTSVHRDEFGITKGTFWAPSGERLAFYKMDESMVTEYPIYVLDSMPATARFVRYPFAGAKSHHVSVGVFDLKTQKTAWLETGEPREQYLTNVAWSGDEKSVLVAVVNRAQNHLWLRQFDAASGKLIKTLFEEEAPTWVEPESPAAFVPKNDQLFVWQSERSGFNHLYLYDLSGKMLRQLSSGAFPVTRLWGFDEKGETVFYQTADESGLNRYVWRSNLKTGNAERLASEEGTHAPILSPDGAFWLDNFQNEGTPRFVYCSKTEPTDDRKLIFAAKNPLEEIEIGQTRLVTLQSSGGFALNGRLILPPNFDESKKYPAIVYVYGGPHAQLVANTWLAGGELWMHRMAALGYVFFSIDGRGSAHRGHRFESAVHRKLGDAEIEDQVVGANYLKAQPFIDGEKLGVYGWSFGGFMTTSLMTRTDLFKVGVAGGPVIDWRMYEIMYTERYMDTPVENPEGYANADLLPRAGDLKGKLLQIHGTDDDVVLWQHSLKFIKACVEKGKPIDYFAYPGHLHNVLGKDRAHLFQKIEAYFLQNLPPN